LLARSNASFLLTSFVDTGEASKAHDSLTSRRVNAIALAITSFGDVSRPRFIPSGVHPHPPANSKAGIQEAAREPAIFMQVVDLSR
jgi:hypothetical protein